MDGGNSNRAPPEQRVDFLNIFQRDSHYPIFIRLCELLPIGSIVTLTRTCKRLSNLYRSLLPLQWNIDRMLSRFVRDPLSFRSQMAEYDAMISGSFALQYFKRVQWRESDLDIYIEHGHLAEVFCQYLVKAEGYRTVKVYALGNYPRADPQEVCLPLTSC